MLVFRILFAIGLALVTAGVWMIYRPAAFILLGVLLMLIAIGLGLSAPSSAKSK